MFVVDRIIPAPDDPRQWDAWRAWLSQWRADTLQRIQYDDDLYRRPEFRWASRCYCCGFAMLCDELFYDHETGAYTVDAFLEHGLREFGGYDAIVLWHAYPNLGFDARNQFDYYRELPGGLAGVGVVVRTCHAAGVKVFLAYNPWDTGTRREAHADAEVLVELIQQLDADGIFLDTMRQGADTFRATLDAAKPGVVLEAEGMPPIEHLHDHHASWAQWFTDSDAPGVLQHTWLERRHMQHQIRRWDRDHSGELHSAWMNGSGVMVWENVFGSRNGWNARDRSTLRLMLPIQRRYADVFLQGHWTPLVDMPGTGVFASLWEMDGTRLWTVINRAEQRVDMLLHVPVGAEQRCFDLIRGVEIMVEEHEGQVELPGMLAARGIGAYLVVDQVNVDDTFTAFLLEQAQRYARASDDTTFPDRPIALRPVASTPARVVADVPHHMLIVNGSVVDLLIAFRRRECGMYDGAPFVNIRRPWHPDLHGMVTQQRTATLSPFAIGRSEVTNQEFFDFLQATAYQPRHHEQFLKHWQHGRLVAGMEHEPVVYVDLDDARAYCRWAGMRLPTEAEWQHALETSGEQDGQRRVWNWTESERTDGRTRFCVLKGGADYQAQGSEWYADGGPKPPQFSAKFLLMWSGLSRCATIGFRCVVALQDTNGP